MLTYLLYIIIYQQEIQELLVHLCQAEVKSDIVVPCELHMIVNTHYVVISNS